MVVKNCFKYCCGFICKYTRNICCVIVGEVTADFKRQTIKSLFTWPSGNYKLKGKLVKYKNKKFVKCKQLLAIFNIELFITFSYITWVFKSI